ncbi:MAG: type II toxin-antitoxin system RelE/ParE family toxin [bacterium]|nr:type II toxin-antitoxin system RelE/ParE family toxin [bacterium]MCY3961305.1 type II toxin-antitoxin system RelE/ParE family toxin [bacterium]
MYRVELSPAAQRQVRRLAPEAARQVRDVLRNLVDEPRPARSVKLSGFAAVWRVRAGQLRIIYEVHDDERRLMVLRVARRDERTYRGL